MILFGTKILRPRKLDLLIASLIAMVAASAAYHFGFEYPIVFNIATSCFVGSILSAAGFSIVRSFFGTILMIFAILIMIKILFELGSLFLA